MLQHQRSILVSSLIFLTFVGWVKSGETICVSAGDTCLLFSKSDTSNICKEVFLYANGIKKNMFIGSWKWENGIFKETSMRPDYNRTIVIDRDGSIWILSVKISDAGKYILQCDNQNNVNEVQLKLSEVMECQHDATFMKKHSGSSDGILISILVIVIIQAGVQAVMSIICRYRQSKNRNFEREQKLQFQENCQQWIEHYENLKREQIALLEQNRPQWMKHFGKLKWEEILKLLNHDQQKGLQSYCNDLTFRKIRELENKKLGESWNYDTTRPVMEQGAQSNSSQALGSGPVVDINESKGTSQK